MEPGQSRRGATQLQRRLVLTVLNCACRPHPVGVPGATLSFRCCWGRLAPACPPIGAGAAEVRDPPQLQCLRQVGGQGDNLVRSAGEGDVQGAPRASCPRHLENQPTEDPVPSPPRPMEQAEDNPGNEWGWSAGVTTQNIEPDIQEELQPHRVV